MKDTENRYNPYGDDKVIAACSIFGMMDTSGRRFSGAPVIRAIGNMHDRGNGLGGGFGAYGIYPDYADQYAMHIMFEDRRAQREVEEFLKEHFQIVQAEEIPVRRVARINNPPLVWRYFVEPLASQVRDASEEDFIVQTVMRINSHFNDVCVFSCGKNMGVFKGVGYPEEIADYFRLEEYEGYLWTAHGRFPTNSKGWWGGAHPFSILDWTVVHNGEISSYGINRRYLEMFGYHCTMHTDTEVVAYAVDLLLRRHQLPVEIAVKILAPMLWTQIDRLPPAQQELHRRLRQVYASLLLNGPFTVIVAHAGEMIGLTDRIRLRPLAAATKGDVHFLSSEESSIRLICPDLDRVWTPMGGEPVISRLKNTPDVDTAAGKYAASRGGL